MPLINNRTPFTAQDFILPDPDGQNVLLVVVVSVFEAEDNGKLRLAANQRQVRIEDEYYGEPGWSSVRYEGELALEKPFVEVIVNAHAYAPNRSRAHSVRVELHVGEMHKVLDVFGDRTTILGLPDAFERMPIIYERAFGGIDTRPANPAKHSADPRNPIGFGFKSSRPCDPSITSKDPNIAYPNKSNVPAGFGAVARNWKPRVDFAGTFDSSWLDERWPLLPTDFDARHYQAAPDDQQLKQVEGGEVVRLKNMTPDGLWEFRLPRLDLPVSLFYDDRYAETALRMDTIWIEADECRVTLTSRLALPVIRGRAPLNEIVLGHVTPGWLRARRARKTFVDRTGFDGTDPRSPTYVL